MLKSSANTVTLESTIWRLLLRCPEGLDLDVLLGLAPSLLGIWSKGELKYYLMLFVKAETLLLKQRLLPSGEQVSRFTVPNRVKRSYGMPPTVVYFNDWLVKEI